MEFTLVYRGPLKANGTTAEKQRLRRAFHRQLQRLWQQVPLNEYGPPNGYWLDDEPPSTGATLIQHLNGFRFAPLVSPKLSIVAELAITLLRPEPPGAIITQGGDIDNRLKTLLDALRVPKVPGEIPKDDHPTGQENPFFCLLEDDVLVTKLSVMTDRLLEPAASLSEVQLLIHVITKKTRGTWGNAALD